MRKTLPILALTLAMTATAAQAQTAIRPDPTPRLPPQEGQGPGIEDQQFLARAANLSEAQTDAGKLAAEKAQDPALKALGASIAKQNAEIHQSVTGMAGKSGVEIGEHPSHKEWKAEMERLKGLSGADFDKAFLEWQLSLQKAMVDIYQQQASHTPDSELAKFAITTLVPIKAQFDETQKVGEAHDVKIGTVKNPIQYR